MVWFPMLRDSELWLAPNGRHGLLLMSLCVAPVLYCMVSCVLIGVMPSNSIQSGVALAVGLVRKSKISESKVPDWELGFSCEPVVSE